MKRGETIAVRSDSIIEARFSLTAKQNELLDMLLCEIRDDEQYQYVISVDKYKVFYNTDTSNLYRDLKKAVKKFEGEGFRIIDKTTGEEIYYSWFSKIHYKPKKAEIQVNVDLDFKKLLWEVKKKIYYDITNTLNFKSNYSQRIYYYLKSFEDTGWRKDSLEVLQHKLECPKSYKNYADFKRAVLDVAQEELKNTSDIEFTYKTSKTGRKVTHIEFFIKSKNKNNLLSEVALDQDSEEDMGDNIPNKSTDNNTQLVLQVKSFMTHKISEKSILTLLKVANNDIEKIRYNYEIMKRQKHVKSVVGWLKAAIKNCNYELPIESEQISVFNSYPQRQYDFDYIEKQMMGWDK